jgi:elongation factor P
MDANKLRFGHKVLIDGQPYIVLMATLRQQPRLASKMITKMKNLLTGSIIERTFTGGDKIDEADITTTPAKYLYNDGSSFYFMDNETFEQFEFTADKIGDSKDFLIEDTDVYVMRFNGNPVDIDLPPTVTMEVVETEPGVRGDTAQGGSKPAKLATGLMVNVPLFINEGDKIVINTETREYRERITRSF